MNPTAYQTRPTTVWDWLNRPAPPGASSESGDSVPGAFAPGPDAPLRWQPGELEACLAARAGAPAAPLDAQALEEMRAAHARWHADAATGRNLEALATSRARVVVTGQQPDLLAGPLLVVWKTLAAVKLAAALGQAHPELQFVPVFWVASEDHDFQEIRRVHWPGHDGRLERFELPDALWTPGRMVGPLAAGSVIDSFSEQVRRTLPETPAREAELGAIAKAYQPTDGEPGGADLETGFCRLLLALFAGSGLLIVSPTMVWVRRAAAPLMARELEHPGASSAAVMARGAALRGAGFEPSLHRHEGSLNLFRIDSRGRRHALRRSPGGDIACQLAGGAGAGDARPCMLEALRAELAEDPARFSFNVVTRPLAQDFILPTVAQVVGPGEAAYLAQVEAVYDDFGVFAPVRWPRPTVTLIQPRVARQMEKLGLDAGALSGLAPEALREALAAGERPAAAPLVEAELERQRAALAALRDRIGLPGVPAIDSAFERLRQALDKGFQTLLERLRQQQAQDDAHLARGRALLAASLRPDDQPQERLLNPLVPFAIGEGLDWPMRLAARVAIEPGSGEQWLRLGEP